MQRFSSDTRSLQAAADAAFIESNTRRRANGQLVMAMILLGQGMLEYPRAHHLFRSGQNSHRGSFTWSHLPRWSCCCRRTARKWSWNWRIA